MRTAPDPARGAARQRDAVAHGRHAAPPHGSRRHRGDSAEPRPLKPWRRRITIVGALVVAAVGLPVAAYACGFDGTPVAAVLGARHPVQLRVAAEPAAPSAAGTATESGRAAHPRAASAAAPATPSASASGSASASASASAASSASASATSSAPPPSSAPPADTAAGRFGLPLFDNLQPVADATGTSVAAVAAQVRAGTAEGVIASYPMAQWIVDDHQGFAGDVARTVDAAAAAGRVAVLAAYDIPHRDCGAYSAGGAADAAAYEQWIRDFAGGLGTHRAVIVIEPDAIGLAPNCLNAAQRAERYALIKYAVDRFAAQGSWTYIDAGNSDWLSVGDAATALKAAGIADATGFALNTAQSRSDAELIPYGDRLSAAVGGAHYVVDSSRNGLAPANTDWCNPPGKGLGHAPTEQTGHALLDAYLWIKTPGGSDGDCNGGPDAGRWFPSYAEMLVRNAKL